MANTHMLLGNKGQVLFCLILVNVWEAISGQIRYSIPEEMQKGSIVGNIAKDLGLDIKELSDRGIRIVGRGRTQYFTLNIKSGYLYPTERVDREQICGQLETCLLNFEIIVEDKMKVFGVEVEITDINDNAPRFQEDELEFRFSELAAVGTRYSLEGAQDPDVGTNSVQGYYLSSNKHFFLDVQTGADGDKHAELVLEKSLDREEQAVHDLILTATDGGDPVRSGTAQIRVIVLDANDNAPVFSQPVYKVSVLENVPVGSLLLTVNATDPDEAINSEVTYSLRKMKDKASQIFQVDSKTGEISTVGNLDYEEAALYEMEVQAKDLGDLSARSKVLVTVVDVNDNAPKITIASLFSSVSEDSPPETLIALLNIRDKDSGENGEVTCSIPGNLPFRLQKSFDNYYSLVTDTPVDRERVSDYNVTITATDRGTPNLDSKITILVQISDINDNAPIFNQTSYTFYITENNPRGASVCSLKANDPDRGENAQVTYSVTEGQIQEAPLSSSISINSETGALYALRSFDYEQFREIRFQVQAQDAGSPPLSSNVSVTLFLLDQNDNSPHILHPSFPTDGSTGVELAPRSSEPGYLVTKVVAVDADSGQNAWLSYQLLKATEPGLFSVGLHSGEIRTARYFLDKDALKQSLVVLVKDNGQPPLSATATVTVVVADSIPEILSDLNSLSAPVDPQSSLTLYLVIAVASVSCLFFTFLIVLVALRLRRWRNSQLFDSSSVTFSGVPVSQFVGLDGVRAFLHSYSREVSLTTDSRKSQFTLPKLNYSSTLTCESVDKKKESVLMSEDLSLSNGDQPLFQSLRRAAFFLVITPSYGRLILIKSLLLEEEQAVQVYLVSTVQAQSSSLASSQPVRRHVPSQARNA
ncbi:protocadherin gamma-A12-like [Gopherus flavomarginatus]|uniref:protocadherin gamma-A12-like n=1 Tax=Gopherus flavomarginatus TaxID=286002 RepID=UPI0021CBF6D6|nr:protocadherin gamma-A12-like [Gopherus flavomarginatus]